MLRNIVRIVAAGVLAFVAMAVSASALDLRMATVNADALKLREDPSTECRVLLNAYRDDHVLVLETEDDWARVNYKGTEGFMSVEYLNFLPDGTYTLGQGVITGNVVNVRSQPSTDSNRISQLTQGSRVEVIGVKQGWYVVKVSGKEAYIHSDYLEVTSSPQTSSGSSSSSSDATTTFAATGSDRSDVVQYAQQFLGTPYRYGANGPSSFDCSGFVSYCFKKVVGVTLNRSSAGMMSNGSKVDKSNLQPGDLVFFRSAGSSKAATHVGIFVGKDGGKNKFIHCSSARSGGVKFNYLEDSYYSGVYVGSRRILS